MPTECLVCLSNYRTGLEETPKHFYLSNSNPSTEYKWLPVQLWRGVKMYIESFSLEKILRSLSPPLSFTAKPTTKL